MVSNAQPRLTRSHRARPLKDQATTITSTTTTTNSGPSPTATTAAQDSSCDESRTSTPNLRRKTGPLPVIPGSERSASVATATAEDLVDPRSVSISSKRPKWSPIDRYWSTNSSLPDYGTAQSKMGSSARDRMKQINAQPHRFVNISGANEPLPKRQRRDSVVHPVLTTQTLIVAPEHIDLTASQSKTDGEPSSTPINVMVDEYRAAQRHANGKPSTRTRVRRIHKTGSNSPLSDDPIQAEPPDTGVLAKKGARPRYLTAQKRSVESVETSSEGEDELFNSPAVKKQRTEDGRRTNFSEMSSIKQPKLHSSRGDIQKTHFKTKYDESKPRLRIKRAASGKFSIVASNLPQEQQPFLVADSPNCLVAKNHAGKSLPYTWLEVNLSTCLLIKHSLQNSTHILVKRSIGKDVPSLLMLEFDDINAADCLFHWACRLNKSSRGIKMMAVEADQLERVFTKQFEESKGFGDVHQQEHSSDEITMLLDEEISKDSGQNGGSKPPGPLSQALGGRQKMTSIGKEGRSLRGSMRSQSSALAPILIDSPGGDTMANDLVRPFTRRVIRRKSTPPRPPTPERWTSKNPDWSTSMDWGRPLIFPATGKNRATVDKDDIPRLDQGEFLNDNLIIFYLRYLQDKLEKERKDLSDRIYFLNTWFFEKLKPTKGRNINYEGVRGWTAKIDLFTYDYIIVPVNESSHWYLAIICNPSKLLAPKTEDVEVVSQEDQGDQGNEQRAEGDDEGSSHTDDDDIVQITSDVAQEEPKASRFKVSEKRELPTSKASAAKLRPPRKSYGSVVRKYDPDEPRIITLDSLGNPHSPTCSILRDYLLQEMKHRKNIDIDTPFSLGMTAKGIPEQSNYYDCGPFLLGYIQEFLKSPDQFVRSILQKEEISWDIEPAKLRDEARDVIFRLQRQQQARLAEEKESKKLARIRRQTPNKDIQASNAPPRAGSIPPNRESPSLIPSPRNDEDIPVADAPATGNKAVDIELTAGEARSSPSPVSEVHKAPGSSLLHPLEGSSQENCQASESHESHRSRLTHLLPSSDRPVTAGRKRASSLESDSSEMEGLESIELSADEARSNLLRPIRSSSSPSVRSAKASRLGSPQTSSSPPLEILDDPVVSQIESEVATRLALTREQSPKHEHRKDVSQ